MTNPTNLLRLHSVASAYGVRPSGLFEVETELGEFQLDEACLLIGRHVESNVNNGKDPFDGLASEQAVKKEYRSVKHLAKKKVAVKEDGTW